MFNVWVTRDADGMCHHVQQVPPLRNSTLICMTESARKQNVVAQEGNRASDVFNCIYKQTYVNNASQTDTKNETCIYSKMEGKLIILSVTNVIILVTRITLNIITSEKVFSCMFLS